MAQVLTLVPDATKDMIRGAQALYNADKLDDAYTVVQDYLAKEPNDAQALILAATILKKAKKTPIAYSLAKRATELKPDRSETWNTLGQCAQHLWKLDEAMASYEKALKRAQNKEHRALYLNNIGSIFIDQGKFQEAEKHIRQALDLAPDDAFARHNLGLSLLAQKRWKEGWPYYSASVGTFNRLTFKYRSDPEEPAWDGTKGQKVIVHGEQGLGDEISFASMIPDACNDAQIIVDCDKRLTGLFRRSFPQAKVYGTRTAKQLAWDEADRTFDASISMGELGKFYRNDESAFPGTPYLVPCPDRTEGWRATFAAKKKPVIGIAWSGGTWENGASNRYLPLDEWAPIFQAIDAHWVSLEYKDAAKAIQGTPVVQYPWATLTKDYDDTAALVAACDLVVTMQTAVAHLAGALGVPVWVMVPSNSQWRYGESDETLPWYKSLRIFKARGSWGPVVHRIANELKGWRK
jgi:tetratricopeptide (TPR) repeat protein